MNNKLTEIAYILDRSGSMHRLVESAISGFNTFLKDQQKSPGEARLSLILFDDEYLVHADRAPLGEVRPLDSTSYVPRACTALLDAIGRTIDRIGKKLAKTPEQERPGKVIIAIYTDGYENASTDYSAKKIRKMIRHQSDKYSWEFLFLAANEDAIATAASYGIDRKNASSVAFSKAGTKASYQSISRRIHAHRSVMHGDASPQEQRDAAQDLESIVQEESDNHSD